MTGPFAQRLERKARAAPDALGARAADTDGELAKRHVDLLDLLEGEPDGRPELLLLIPRSVRRWHRATPHRAAVHALEANSAPSRSNDRRQLVDQALPLDRFLGHIAVWLIEVGSLGLRHRVLALGKALLLELFDRALHLAQLPGQSD